MNNTPKVLNYNALKYNYINVNNEALYEKLGIRQTNKDNLNLKNDFL